MPAKPHTHTASVLQVKQLREHLPSVLAVYIFRRLCCVVKMCRWLFCGHHWVETRRLGSSGDSSVNTEKTLKDVQQRTKRKQVIRGNKSWKNYNGVV